jgi:hypothetical protein
MSADPRFTVSTEESKQREQGPQQRERVNEQSSIAYEDQLEQGEVIVSRPNEQLNLQRPPRTYTANRITAGYYPRFRRENPWMRENETINSYYRRYENYVSRRRDFYTPNWRL